MVLRNIRHLRISVILFKVATLGDIHFRKVNSQLNTEPSVFNICIFANIYKNYATENDKGGIPNGFKQCNITKISDNFERENMHLDIKCTDCFKNKQSHSVG